MIMSKECTCSKLVNMQGWAASIKANLLHKLYDS